MTRAHWMSLLLWALPALARADIAPPSDYVETCTLEKQTRPGRTCVLCGTYYGDPEDKCAKESGDGFSKVCRSRGASTWSEVWCREEVAAAASAEATPAAQAEAAVPGESAQEKPATQGKSGGLCGLDGGGHGGSQSLALILVASVGLLLVRRKR